MLCDRLAADPTDPDKPADVKGVAEIAPSDVATAIKFCKIAAPASRRALFQLGRAYAANGQLADAIAAYRKAIDKGSSAAMVELGILYAAGSGVAKDEAQARKLFERAAAAGNPRGVTRLTALSGGGAAGPPADPAEARAMLMKAAEANSAEAQYQLGVMYAEGTGGPKDDVAARAMFEKAAAQNHAEALDWLGSFRALRPRRTAGHQSRQGLLREGRRARQRRRQGRAQAPGMFHDRQRPARQLRRHSLLLAASGSAVYAFTAPSRWIGSTHSTVCGFSTGSMSRLMAMASPSLRTSTHSSTWSGLALIS